MESHMLEHILDGREKPTNLQLALLKSITDNFSKEREIGHGGFATVYKGVLPNGNIAVKRIMSGHTIDEKLFYREVSSLLTINHPNIVRFLGFCASTDQTAIKQDGKIEHIYAEIRERLICFEYISNGNLQEYITDELRGLDWCTRYKLIKGICDGLHYLHMEKSIYHMDLKPANILLDNDMVPKITDFGLSRLDEKSQTLSVTRHGTPGYCAPEYLNCGQMSFKSDIYSLGTIIIELVTGVKSIPDNNKNNVLRRWRHRWRKTGKESPLYYQQISPYSEDDMLGVEPLEIHFDFERHKEMSCLLQLTNDTDACIAFEVQKLSHLLYNTKPQKGIVPPHSKCGVDITLQPMEEAPQRANVFIVRSTKVIYGLTAKDITTVMFSRDTNNVVDEVNLDVVFDQQLQRGSGGTVPEISQDYGDKDEKLALCHVGQKHSNGNPPLSNRDAAVYWMSNYPLVGRETEMNELRGYTTRAHFSTNFQVMSVWGMAGIGKSALVRSLYYDRMLGTIQFNKYIWMDVSHPFNLRDFARSLLSDFGSEEDPIKECHELLKQDNCLLVIDDLRTKEEWDLIQNALVSRTSGSATIVITTEASVAAYCTNNKAQVFNVKGLEDDAAFDLFRKEVHRKNTLTPLIHFTHFELDGLILKCGGLPRVIVSLAAVLAVQTVTLMDNVRSMNRNFVHYLENNLENDSLRGLFDWLHSYFSTFRHSLQACIVYLSMFHRDHTIRGKRLVRRWIAEHSDEESMVEKGEKFFSDLLYQIQPLTTTTVNGTRMVSCQINGFIREYIISRGWGKDLWYELGPNCVPDTQRKGCHLIILRDWDRDIIQYMSIDFSRLRSLTVFGKWESFFISQSMRLLWVLDLEDASGVNDEDLKNMVKWLHRLRFLSLQGCSKIFNLPSSLGDIRQLQALDVRNTSIVRLPASITKLEELQYIRAGTTIQASTSPPASSSTSSDVRRCRLLSGIDVPRGIGKLTVLQTLGVVNVGASGGKAIVKEIKKLNQLRKLGVSGINRRNIKEFFCSIAGHVHLESLLVCLDKESPGCFDGISLPCENLQSLKLYGLQDKLPLSRYQLSKLRKLDLEMATLDQSGIELLAELPKLSILRLRVQKLQNNQLHFHAELCGEEMLTFENVKILEIACSSNELIVVAFGSKSMKNLDLLEVDCSSASLRIIGLHYLFELKEVLLKGADDEIKEALECQMLAQYPRTPPAVKLVELPHSS